MRWGVVPSVVLSSFVFFASIMPSFPEGFNGEFWRNFMGSFFIRPPTGFHVLLKAFSAEWVLENPPGKLCWLYESCGFCVVRFVYSSCNPILYGLRLAFFPSLVSCPAAIASSLGGGRNNKATEALAAVRRRLSQVCLWTRRFVLRSVSRRYFYVCYCTKLIHSFFETIKAANQEAS